MFNLDCNMVFDVQDLLNSYSLVEGETDDTTVRQVQKWLVGLWNDPNFANNSESSLWRKWGKSWKGVSSIL